MKRFIIASALVAALAAPVSAGTVDTVKDAINDADAYAAAYLDGSWLETVFSSVFGLTYLGAWFDGIGGVPAGGEWIHAGGDR